jgi:hypothetical protein
MICKDESQGLAEAKLRAGIRAHHYRARAVLASPSTVGLVLTRCPWCGGRSSYVVVSPRLLDQQAADAPRTAAGIV